jgi:hypothetical protein
MGIKRHKPEEMVTKLRQVAAPDQRPGQRFHHF